MATDTAALLSKIRETHNFSWLQTRFDLERMHLNLCSWPPTLEFEDGLEDDVARVVTRRPAELSVLGASAYCVQVPPAEQASQALRSQFSPASSHIVVTASKAIAKDAYIDYIGGKVTKQLTRLCTSEVRDEIATPYVPEA
jgi:hypothetical protein